MSTTILRCPKCRAHNPLANVSDKFVCASCAFTYPVKSDLIAIPLAIPLDFMISALRYTRCPRCECDTNVVLRNIRTQLNSASYARVECSECCYEWTAHDIMQKLNLLRLREQNQVRLHDKRTWAGPAPDTVAQAEDPNKDSSGKVLAGTLQSFSPALKQLAELMTRNAKPNGKYERDSWTKVKNGKQLYLDALWRHLLEGPDNIDEESGMHHDVAIAFNALAILSFRLTEEEYVRYNVRIRQDLAS